MAEFKRESWVEGECEVSLSSHQNKRGYLSIQKRSARLMFCPSSCVFVYACLGKDFVIAMLCCLDWMTLQEDQIIEGPPIGDLSSGRRVFDKFIWAISCQE